MSEEVRLFRAFGIADASGPLASPGAVLVRAGAGLPILIASGRESAVVRHEAAVGARVFDLGDSVILPGLVNAHTHLDLTHIGPQPFDPVAGFAGWARMIVNGRLRDSVPLRSSVEEGLRKSIAGGVMAVGDIAGIMQTEPVRALQDSGLLGVSFIEYFGVGARQEEMTERVALLLDEVQPPPPVPPREVSESLRAEGATLRVRVGLQPHAPYTAGLRLMQWTARQHIERRLPLSTHLAETAAEREFVARGTGPFRAFLEGMGFWDDSILKEVGHGRSPIEHLVPALRSAPWLVAHANDCDDLGLHLLAETGTSIAYCPRSSSYFRNHESFGPHRYRDMLRAGINVCLGTDSIVNLPPSESDRISTLDEMRFLFRRDAVDPALLLKMTTINGAIALGLDPHRFQLSSSSGGAIAGLIAVDVSATEPSRPLLERVMLSSGPPQVLATPTGWRHG